MTYSASDIKKNVSIEQILRHYGSMPNGQGKWRCLLPDRHRNGDEHHSGTIKDGRVFCWSQKCFGEKGADIFAIVGLVEHLPDFKDQRAKIEELFSLNGSTAIAREITATYDYVDESENLLFQAVRYDPKDFRQRRPDGQGGWIWNLKDTRVVLYRLPDVLQADSVLIVEGEKDVATAYTMGLPESWAATCNPMGAGKWNDSYSESLQGKDVIVCPDRDEVGHRHGKLVAQSLQDIAKGIRWLDLPHGKDLSEWADQGGTVEGLTQLLKAAKPWEAEPVLGQDGIHLRTFANITPEAVAWAWEGRIAVRAVNLIVGEPDKGKTSIALTLAAQLSTGTLAGDWEGQPVHVIIASCEDSPSTTIRPRLEMAGADLSKVHFLIMKKDGVEGGMRIPEDLDQVESAMKKCGARVLIIDPIMGHLGDVDSYKDQNIRKALGPLAGLAERVDGVVLGIMHLNKRDCASITNRVGGSVGFVAAARSVLLAAQDPEKEEHGHGVLVHAKCNLAAHAPTLRYQLEGVTFRHEEIEIQTSRVVWGEEVDHIHVGDVLQTPARGSDEQGQKAEAKDWLRVYLAKGGKPAKDVLNEGDKLGFSQKTLYRAKKELGIESSKREYQGEFSWFMPSNGQDAANDGQDTAKDSPLHEYDHHCATPCKKSNKSKTLSNDGQGSTGDHPRGKGGHHTEGVNAETPPAGLYDQKEAMMVQGPDGGFEEFISDAD